MQAYGQEFAKVYNRIWNGFSTTYAPVIHDFAMEMGGATGSVGHSLLDLCCGTGQFCGYFLEKGWSAAGLDASPGMLRWAGLNNRRALEEGRFRVIEADATSFEVEGRFGLVTSIFDAINHFEGEAALEGCFGRAREALLPGGLFVFDINTRRGLRNWSSFDIQDDDSLFLVKRGMFVQELDRAWLEVIGFTDSGGGKYERFREIVFNYAWPVKLVLALLEKAGFVEVEVRKAKKGLPVAHDPEGEDRVFFSARRRAER